MPKICQSNVGIQLCSLSCTSPPYHYASFNTPRSGQSFTSCLRTELGPEFKQGMSFQTSAENGRKPKAGLSTMEYVGLSLYDAGPDASDTSVSILPYNIFYSGSLQGRRLGISQPDSLRNTGVVKGKAWASHFKGGCSGSTTTHPSCCG